MQQKEINKSLAIGITSAVCNYYKIIYGKKFSIFIHLEIQTKLLLSPQR